MSPPNGLRVTMKEEKTYSVFIRQNPSPADNAKDDPSDTR